MGDIWPAAPSPPSLHWRGELDEGAATTRIGLIVFDEDLTTEGDLARLRPADGAVAVHVSRMRLPTDASAAGLQRTADDLAAAAARLVPSARLDAIGYSCTTGTLQLGYDAVAEAIGRGRPGVPVATPITGAVKAFAALGVRRISLLSPYGADLNGLIVAHLAGQGVEVTNLASFNVADETDIARVSRSSIRDAAIGIMQADAGALFVSCTALRGTELIVELEQALGRPVVTSTQAMWWEALGLSGQAFNEPGFGRLMGL